MRIVLSAIASQQLTQLLGYLEDEWSISTRRNFQKKLDQKWKAMRLIPFGFPETNIFKGCRRCVVTPQTSVFYKVKNDVIFVVAIKDNRQDL